MPERIRTSDLWIPGAKVEAAYISPCLSEPRPETGSAKTAGQSTREDVRVEAAWVSRSVSYYNPIFFECLFGFSILWNIFWQI